MKEERTTPLRARMIEDMRIRGMGDKAQEALTFEGMQVRFYEESISRARNNGVGLDTRVLSIPIAVDELHMRFSAC